MRRSVLAIMLLFSILSINSCKKATTTTDNFFSTPFIPLDLDSLMPTHAVSIYMLGVPYTGVSGVLVACRVYGTFTDTSGYVNQYRHNWETAIFENIAKDSFIKAGTVSVNDTVLNDTLYTNVYGHYDPATTWRDNSLNHWTVTGSGSIPAFTADINGAMPIFTGTLPSVISKTDSFSLTFNSSNTINGDSAYVLIYYHGSCRTSPVVSANGGTATLLFNSFFIPIQADNYFSLGFTATGPFYKGDGYIAVVVYHQDVQTLGGKRFAFIQQKVTLGIISFI